MKGITIQNRVEGRSSLPVTEDERFLTYDPVWTDFIGGSMGSVVEKIARAMDHSLKTRTPFLMISRSGGARMMEAGLSLMQMAKTSAKIALLDQAKIPHISLLTDPTTGGVTASYAMLGDFNIAEPQALIGFAGPRVIRETIGKDLPRAFKAPSLSWNMGSSTSSWIVETSRAASRPCCGCFSKQNVPLTESSDSLTQNARSFTNTWFSRMNTQI